MRENPSSRSIEIDVLPAGQATAALVHSDVQRNGDDDWYFIAYNGKHGWIRDSDVRMIPITLTEIADTIYSTVSDTQVESLLK